MANIAGFQIGDKSICIPHSAYLHAGPLGATPIIEVDIGRSYFIGAALIEGSPVSLVDAAPLIGCPPSKRGMIAVCRTGTKRIGFFIDGIIGARAVEDNLIATENAITGSIITASFEADRRRFYCIDIDRLIKVTSMVTT